MNKTKAPKSFEEAMQRLQALLDELQQETTPLAQAVQLYAEAASLIAYCHEELDNARLEIEQIDTELAALGRPEGAV